jgi:SAM-dependent methyltransferase
MDDYTPDYDEPFVEIGGAASVGNTAACLVYAMGYRNLQLYGYDSSHRADKSHAFHQPLNNGDPCAWVTFCGKQYLVSLTMKLQAEKFQETARDLKQLGCTIAVHGDGLLPDMYNTPKETMTEQEKYERMWAISEYRTLSPGEDAVPAFLKQVTERGTLLDIGCGTGRAGLKLKEAGFDVTLMDFTDNSRDYHALTLPFVRHDLTQSLPLAATYGYCCDVMEHIAPDQIVRVLLNILWATDRTFFQISTEPDRFGAVINQDLHLTVMPGSWWLDTIRVLGVTVDWFEETAGDIQCLVTTRRTHAAR